MADFLLAAWLAWITPLLAALSSFLLASRSSTMALSLSPASAASRNFRIAVFTEDLTDLLRSRAFSFVLIRLSWDLMLATRLLLSADHGSPPRDHAGPADEQRASSMTECRTERTSKDNSG